MRGCKIERKNRSEDCFCWFVGRIWFIISQEHYEKLLKVYGSIIPEPVKIPELPIDENNLLRPLSPYAVSKVFGELIMRNYYYSYSINTIVSRAFNHEGALRGHQFVTSSIVRQCIEVKLGREKQ
ncbi:MAG: GDP-mannose 4,6-dehydratase [Candidatus Aenigmatarchaeota archaeon]